MILQLITTIKNLFSSPHSDYEYTIDECPPIKKDIVPIKKCLSMKKSIVQIEKIDLNELMMQEEEKIKSPKSNISETDSGIGSDIMGKIFHLKFF
jgi:hypothetical protein